MVDAYGSGGDVRGFEGQRGLGHVGMAEIGGHVRNPLFDLNGRLCLLYFSLKI